MDRLQFVLVNGSPDKLSSFCESLGNEKGYHIIAANSNGAVQKGTMTATDSGKILMDALSRHEEGKGAESIAAIHPGPMVEFTVMSMDEFKTWPEMTGMRYFMLQPVDYGAIPVALPSVDAGTADATKNDALDRTIDEFCMKIGIPAHIQGSQYIRTAIHMVIESPDLINSITKKLYPGIAQHYGTTPSKVERSIRHAISVVWTRGRVDAINSAFGYLVCTADNKPTNGEFIALMAHRCKGLN